MLYVLMYVYTHGLSFKWLCVYVFIQGAELKEAMRKVGGRKEKPTEQIRLVCVWEGGGWFLLL